MKPPRVLRPVQSSSPQLPPPTQPMPVARRLVASCYRDDRGALGLQRWRGGWWRHRRTHWEEVDGAEIRKAAYRFTEHATWMHRTARGERVEDWAPTRYKIADLLDALAACCHLPDALHPPQWSEDAGGPPPGELVAVANGLLHVPTRALHEHDARLFNQVAVPFAYDGHAEPPLRWLAFLQALWPDDAQSRAALQEFFGYVISGRTDLHKILLLVGPARGGKGTIARILEALVGRGNCCGPTLASLGENFGLSPLIGKPLAVISDARLGGPNVYRVVERLLSVSGEDMLTVDRKYREPWTGTLPTRFFIISNELPRFHDAAGAIATRFIVLTLTESWLGRENPRLTAELLVELPGVLNWALAGLARLTARGRFTEPASSADAIVALQDLVSPVAAFTRERCVRQGEIECVRLYHAWKAWAEENGHKPGSLQTFGRDLRAAVPGLVVYRPRDSTGERPRHYRGITVAQRYNGEDRGPARTSDPVPAGPRPDPLYARVEREPGEDGMQAPCRVCRTVAWWRQPGGAIVCGTCHPRPGGADEKGGGT